MIGRDVDTVIRDMLRDDPGFARELEDNMAEEYLVVFRNQDNGTDQQFVRSELTEARELAGTHRPYANTDVRISYLHHHERGHRLTEGGWVETWRPAFRQVPINP